MKDVIYREVASFITSDESDYQFVKDAVSDDCAVAKSPYFEDQGEKKFKVKIYKMIFE